MVFPGNGPRAKKVPLLLGRESIRRVFKQRSLGLHLGSRRRCSYQASVIADSCVSPMNAHRRTCSSTWGTPPASLSRLHSALVEGRLLYVAPFSHLAPTQAARLEHIHRAGLKIALGCPHRPQHQLFQKSLERCPSVTLAIGSSKGSL